MTSGDEDGPMESGHDLARPAPRGRNAVVLAALVIGVILGAVGLWAAQQLTDSDPFDGGVSSGRYQAVVLTTNRVYFGKLSSASDEFYRLRYGFFLRETTGKDESPQRALLPINRELQGPENTMLIRKDEVVLVENLASNSPVQREIVRQIGSKPGS